MEKPIKNKRFQSIRKKLRDPWILFAFCCLCISVLFIVYPLLSIFISSFKDANGVWSLENYATMASRYKYRIGFMNSLKVTALSTVYSTLIAVPLAYLISRYNFKGRNAVITLITMATASPPFLGAYAWIILMGRYGVFNRAVLWLTGVELQSSMQGGGAVIFVITLMVFPLVFLMAFDSFCDEDVTHKEAAMSLGANRLRSFFTVELPLAKPGILTGMFMAALAAFSDFGTPAIIGGEFPLLSTIVYNEFVSEVGGNMGMASTVSIIMIILSSMLLYVQRTVLARKLYAAVSVKRYQLVTPKKVMTFVLKLYAVVVLMMSFLPQITLCVVSFMKWKWGVLTNVFTFDNYIKLFKEEGTPIFMSFALGIVATLLTVVFGIGIAYLIVRKKYKFVSSFINTIIMVPYVVPGTVLAVGFIMAFNNKPLQLTGTWIILVLSYFIRKLPFAVKTAETSLYSIHTALEEAAMVSGAKPLRAFTGVTFPLIIGGIATGATLAFLQIMTELSSTIILYRPPFVTMPIVIFENTMSSGSDFGVAASMGVLLMFIIYIPLLIVNRISRKRPEVMKEGKLDERVQC